MKLSHCRHQYHYQEHLQHPAHQQHQLTIQFTLSLSFLLMNSLIVPGAQCKPTTSGITLQQLGSTSAPEASLKPINTNYLESGLSRQHEGLLVDLLNEQQNDFISKLNRVDLRAADQTGSSALKSKTANQQTDWVPINQQIAESHPKPVILERKFRAQPPPCNKKSIILANQHQQLATGATQSVNNVATINSTKVDDRSDDGTDGEDEDGKDEDEEEEDERGLKQKQQRNSSLGSLDGHESVALESTLMPPPASYRANQYEPDESSGQGKDHEAAGGDGGGGGNNINNPNEPDDDEGPGQSLSDSDTPPDEAAARREQEAAEASEAEAADRSALAEQQAAQREIILAQAQSEAKAIREQQEALLRQQQLQQQILMRRHQNFLDDTDPKVASKKKRPDGGGGRGGDSDQKRPRSSPSSARGTSTAERHMVSPARQASSGGARGRVNGGDTHIRHRQVDSYQERGLRAQGSSNQQQRRDGPPPATQYNLMDNQFSDQPDSGIVDRGHLSLLNSRASGKGNFHSQSGTMSSQGTAGEELGSEDSVRQSQFAHSQSDDAALEAALANSADLSIGARLNLTTSDLLAAAQHHHYGAHYGSLGGHHKGGAGHYYQYAQSKKKGQFTSGFKRGNKKFVISGQSSQHKGHADGHMKWHGKKGKGSHHWDYKHKNKKHYGGGDGYGGGHHYY